jgi:hypothetical protein
VPGRKPLEMEAYSQIVLISFAGFLKQGKGPR